MGLYKTRAIVLRYINLSETDKLVTFLTEHHGKIKCVAKAARRIKSKFGGSLEPFTYNHIIFFRKENQTIGRLNNCDIICSFIALSEDLKKMFTALYFNELVDSLLAESQNPHGLFPFMLESLNGIQNGLNVETLCKLFEIRIMSLAGYAPRLDQCALCKKASNDGDSGYSFIRNGVICFDCGKKNKPELNINTGALNYIRKLTKMTVSQSDRLKIPGFMETQIEAFTHRLIQNQLGREPRCYPFIKKIKDPAFAT